MNKNVSTCFSHSGSERPTNRQGTSETKDIEKSEFLVFFPLLPHLCSSLRVCGKSRGVLVGWCPQGLNQATQCHKSHSQHVMPCHLKDLRDSVSCSKCLC